MVEALATAMVAAEFVPTDWETIVSTLQRGSFDIVSMVWSQLLIAPNKYSSASRTTSFNCS